MEKTSEQQYTDLLRQLASPTIVEPDTLIGYLRDVERLHAVGQITSWQLERARDAYASTIDRDVRQSPTLSTMAAVDPEALPLRVGSSHPDPITGTTGAHPLGTGVGAALGGAAAGATVGTLAGPVGTVIGAAVGAVIGGLAGKGVAELIDPTVEEPYWRDSVVGARPLEPSDI